ncbi:MAG: carboxypeptidase regulatory-like domain-containing protein [Acidobacteriales bacterium]|nr:carboxypeptidase regulatory-like domain-containing protein [Terriglobales bacterium]
MNNTVDEKGGALPTERRNGVLTSMKSSCGRLRSLVCAIGLLIILAFVSASASGETLTGSVKNGTLNQPSVGDEVVLLKLAQGMEEAGHTKTDAQGRFSFDLTDAGDPHLVRVVHQGVTYHEPAPPGSKSVDVVVYNAARKVDGVTATADVMYLQAEKGQLDVMRIFAVDNASKPPRTQMNDQNFEFYIPPDAQIDSAQAQTAGGRMVNSSPVPQKEPGRYAFNFPLRPGTTEFQIAYHLPYSGEARIDPKPVYGLQHFVVIMPQSIQFSAAQGGIYEDKQPPNQPAAIAEVATNTHPGQPLSFTISGAGMLQEASGGNDAGGPGATTAAPTSSANSRDQRPGGGLGPPSDAPDPLEKYRWYILGGFAVALVAGAIYVARRPAGAGSSDDLPGGEPEKPSQTKAARASRPALLLEALKEEIFQLEVEHRKGLISAEEYAKAKAALDQTLDRALKRS